MEPIQYVGIDQLTVAERALLDKLATEYYEKIKTQLKNEETSICIHIKEYSKGGESTKFSIHCHVRAPTKKYEATAADWDFARTLHKVCKDIERQIEHSFKSRKKDFTSQQ